MAVAGLAFSLVLGLFYLQWHARGRPTQELLLPADAPEGLARLVLGALEEGRDEIAFEPVPEPAAYVALRRAGRRLVEGYTVDRDWVQAVLRAVRELEPRASGTDLVEVCLPHSRRVLWVHAGRAPIDTVHRGIRGLTLRHGAYVRHLCPTAAIAQNKSFERAVAAFRADYRLSEESWVEHGIAEEFEAYQLLIRLEPSPSIERLHRGNQIVPITEVGLESARNLVAGMSDWMKAQVQPHGRMVYMYFPSRGTESSENNMIRQFMATLCLQRIAKRERTPEARELAARNLRYNLAQFYRHDGLHGFIEWRGARKLGAAALAALAIVEAPTRADHAEEELALRELVESMQQPDGSFRTFYRSDRNDNQNFYPGEALLLWATLLEEETNAALAQRFERAFEYYRRWHRENRNPAFVPWHTQAYYKVWRRTHDERHRDFIFEMNDRIADFQQWEEAPYEDLRGRFYDPDRPDWGPPHASSTGVYVEGLVDARELAREVGDEDRLARYSLVIRRALRSMMQLQFLDDTDMFYIARRERVRGALRTNEYDNRIRVDNVQHSLMGVFKLLDSIEVEGAQGL
jgi:hypothetical protein